MVIHNRNTPYDYRPKPPISKNTRTALYVTAAVVVVAGAAIGVHFATSSSGGASTTSPVNDAGPPVAGGNYAGSLQLNATGSELAKWQATSSFCAGGGGGASAWQVPDGTVGINSSGYVTLSTTGKSGSCVALVSTGAVSSGVIEADIDFPAVPGKPGTIADWTSVWLTNQADWPTDGEIDAVEAEPATGKNAVAYHWGSAQSPQYVSTDGFAPDGNLPVQGPNLAPGWHVVDIAYTKGFFQVYYDGKKFSTGQDDVITGAPLNLIISSSVTPSSGAAVQQIGGNPPVNSDTSPATIAVKYVKIWSYK